MYICYVDESGHCGTKLNPKQPAEVVCGVLCDLKKLAKSQREHRALLQELGLAELKANDAYRGRKDWADVSPEERAALFDRLLQWSQERSLKLLVSVIDAARFFSRKKSCPLCQRFEYPWEAGAFHVLLGVQRRQSGKKNNKGMTLVVFDEQTGHDRRLLSFFESEDKLSFTDGYTGFKPKPNVKQPPVRFDQIIDVPHFSKSHLAAMIQIADWAAFVIARVLALRVYNESESYQGELSKLDPWYQGIQSLSVEHTAMQRSGADPLCRLYREEIAPNGWNWRSWA